MKRNELESSVESVERDEEDSDVTAEDYDASD